MAAIAPASSSDLLDLLKRSGVLPTERLKALPALGELPSEAAQAATELVQRGFLTRFQSSQLLLGRHKGFRIGPYVIQDLLGRGGMGAVYLAEHKELHRKAALKILAPGKGEDQRLAVERFLREARAAAALDHPNIVRLHDIARHQEVPYIVMEYVEGETLQQTVDRDGRVPYEVAAEYVAQAAAGLQHAHEKGFVHRDIKPGNLIRDHAGLVKILDMGLARSGSDNDKLTEQFDEGAVVGTADFISPEQAINSPKVDARADIYSLGATLYTLILGKPPFDGNTTQKLMQHQLKTAPSLRELGAKVPPELSDVVAKMLAKKPANRYQSAAEVVAALAPWTEHSTRVLVGISRTNLAAGDSHAVPQLKALGSSLRLRDRFDSDSTVNPTEAVAPTGVLSSSETVPDYTEPGADPDPTRPARPKLSRQTQLTIGVGAALLGAIVVIAVLAFGGSNRDKAQSDPPPEQPAPQPQPKPPAPQPKNPNPLPQPKVEPKTAEAVYRFDPGTVTPFQVRLKGGTVVDGQRGALPTGVAAYAIQNDTEARFAVEKEAGVAALGLTHLKGPRAVQIAFELEKAPSAGGLGVKLVPGQSYKLRIEYRAAAGVQMGVGVHTFQYKPVAPYTVSTSVGERWQIAEVIFDRGADPVRIVVENRALGADKTIHLRSVALLPFDPRASNRPRLKTEFGGLEPFIVRAGVAVDPRHPNKKTPRIISQSGPGALPYGWQARAWHADGEMEVFADNFGGLPALGIRNTRAPGSAMLFTPRFECPSGQCLLAVEYFANTRPKAFSVRFKAEDQRQAWDVSRPPVGDGWRTEELPVDLKGASGGFFEFHNNDGNPDVEVRIRSVAVVEPSPISPDRIVYTLDAADLPGFRNAKLGSKKTSGEDEPRIKGVTFTAWKPETESEWVCGPVGDAKAIGITNLNDTVSAQIALELERENGLNLRFAPGQLLRIRVTYRTAGKGRGSVYIQNTDDRKVTDRASLPTSNSGWKTVELVATRAAGPLRCLVDSSEPGEGNTLFVRGVVVSAIGDPRPLEPAPAPKNPAPKNPTSDLKNWSEGTTIYSLDVAKIPPFRVEKEKGKRLSGQAEQLPTGVSCQCWKEGASGEFRRDEFAGVPALGLANLTEEKSSQYAFALEGALKLPLQPGKSYRAKVTYRTANAASGTATVHVVPGYKGIGSTPLTNAADEWKTAALSFTRPPAEDNITVRLVIDNNAEGSGNVLWIRAVEIVELTPPK